MQSKHTRTSTTKAARKYTQPYTDRGRYHGYNDAARVRSSDTCDDRPGIDSERCIPNRSGLHPAFGSCHRDHDLAGRLLFDE